MNPRLPRNTLLRAFGEETTVRLELKAQTFKVGQSIEVPGEPIKHLHFLERGMASMTTTFVDGSEVEVGMFGYESVIGMSALMGMILSLNHIYTQVEGDGYQCTVAAAQREFDRSELFQKLVLRYVQAQLVQTMQSAGCGAMHSVEQRLSRWLLITADRVQCEKFRMSQEFLSHMLGSTRPTVTVVAGVLKREGLIAYRHGEIEILDRPGLEKRSCECYRVICNYLADYEAFDSQLTA